MKEKLHWIGTQEGNYWGRLMPMFCIWPNGNKPNCMPYTLTYYRQPQDKKGKPMPRHIEVKSVHRGKCLATKILKGEAGEYTYEEY